MSDLLNTRLNQTIELLLDRLHQEYNGESVDYKDYTVYTGTTGMSVVMIQS